MFPAKAGIQDPAVPAVPAIGYSAHSEACEHHVYGSIPAWLVEGQCPITEEPAMTSRSSSTNVPAATSSPRGHGRRAVGAHSCGLRTNGTITCWGYLVSRTA